MASLWVFIKLYLEKNELILEIQRISKEQNWNSYKLREQISFPFKITEDTFFQTFFRTMTSKLPQQTTIKTTHEVTLPQKSCTLHSFLEVYFPSTAMT
jgi:hypothetical protein